SGADRRARGRDLVRDADAASLPASRRARAVAAQRASGSVRTTFERRVCRSTAVRMIARHRKKLIALAAVLAAPFAFHGVVAGGTRIEAPPFAAGRGDATTETGGVRKLGRAYARRRGKILEVRLWGTPDEIGYQHGRLLYDEMVADEGALFTQFE